MRGIRQYQQRVPGMLRSPVEAALKTAPSGLTKWAPGTEQVRVDHLWKEAKAVGKALPEAWLQPLGAGGHPTLAVREEEL
ncbi:hypothetical protein [Thermus neutrinimicus]|uniref:hypothetical protein n=1 Tax=Thermus neutrinimicus TaxID=2908149 RepID=UPI001FAAA164|nr:hypothetical protein [Thermus neutrinimicus]